MKRWVGAAVALALIGWAPAAGATHIPPTVTVTPSTGLVDRQVVTVKWSALTVGPGKRNNSILIAQCTAEPELITQGGCGPVRIVGPPAKGKGSIVFAVDTGQVGFGPGYHGGTCGTSTEDVTCWMAVESRRAGRQIEMVSVPITFDVAS